MRSLCPAYQPHSDVSSYYFDISLFHFGNIIHFKSIDINQDASLETLINEHESRSMPETNTLEHVYIPILDAVDGWYLMLLEVKDRTRFVLDVCRSPEKIPIRVDLTDKICGVLGKMFVSPRNSVNFWQGSPDPTDWGEYQYPDAMPHDLPSNDTAVWCLYWLQNDDVFSNRIFKHMGSSDRVRMRAAWYILQADANQMRGFIDVRADLLWRDIGGGK
ncbi:hypothetical protein PIB30_061662 [Stylosanthes scabra]|uniref:Uncharacterized protein n=1 Tax=Stylosanthes scabra TaxID=79078 RepID=A0ABU6TNA6_9FABA|nr:hypothetical protein [Stylosanthes scabra]